MNIFCIEGEGEIIDWVKSAQSLDNYRVVKMLVETTQLLCCTLNEQGIETPYKTRHHNPQAVSAWVMASSANWMNLYYHAIAMLAEYRRRFGPKPFRSDEVLHTVFQLFDPKRFPSQKPTPVMLAMPDEFKDPKNPVQSYRRFYATKPNMRYPADKIPSWFLELRGDIPFEVVNDNVRNRPVLS
jgi:hypothetical protein